MTEILDRHEERAALDSAWALIGEARWQAEPLDVSDVLQLKSKLARVPSTAREPIVALWGRAGISKAAAKAGAIGWSLTDMLRD